MCSLGAIGRAVPAADVHTIAVGTPRALQTEPSKGGRTQRPGAAAAAQRPKVEEAWTPATGALAFKISECGTLSLLSARNDRDLLIAGIAQRGLWATTDGGSTWAQMGTGSGSETIINRPTSIVYDPEHPDTFWETGIYNGPGVYKTTDNGETFAHLGNVSHNDLVAIDFTDSERKTLLVGGHEAPNKFFLSVDAARTWTDVGTRLPPVSGFSALPLVLSSKVYLLGTYASPSAGIFRTEDGGASWSRVLAGGVVNPPLVASDNAIYWMLEGTNGIVRSTDLGATWAKITPPGVIRARDRLSLIELPDGKLVATGPDRLSISSDKGTSWRSLGPVFPFDPTGVVYSRFRKTFYLWRSTCGNSTPEFVLPDAILAFGFDYEAR